jgi:hypothetical protein
MPQRARLPENGLAPISIGANPRTAVCWKECLYRFGLRADFLSLSPLKRIFNQNYVRLYAL